MAEGGSGTNIRILAEAPIDYARGCSPLLLDHLPLEEGALITWFFYFLFFRVLQVIEYLGGG